MNSVIVVTLLAVVFSTSLMVAVFTFRLPVNAATGSTVSRKERFGLNAAKFLNSNTSEELQTKLNVVEKTYGGFFYERLLYSLIGLIFAFGFIYFLYSKIVLALIVSILGALAGWLLPKRQLDAEVESERYLMRQAVNVYEDLGSVAIAGGAEINSALRNAVNYGEGRSWMRLRTAARSSLNSESTFSLEIAKLAELYGLSELENLSNLLVVSETGGLAQASLEDMSNQQAKISAQEAIDEAEKNTSRMIISIGFLFISFVLFLLFIVLDGLTQIDL